METFFPRVISPLYNISRYESEAWQAKILKKYLPSPGSSVLDLCCGSGQYRAYFKSHKYVGVDKFDNNFASKEMKNVKFYVEDASKLSFDDSSFDFIFCSAGLEHVRDKNAVASELSRVLKKGAYAYVSAPSHTSKIYDVPRRMYCSLGAQKYYGHGHHYYSRADLRDILEKNGMEVVRFYPETGFLALCALSIIKWKQTVVSILRNQWQKRMRKEDKQITDTMADKSNAAVSSSEDVDIRDDHGYKTDYYSNGYEINPPKNLPKEFGFFGKILTKAIFAFDYLLPIPIVAGWTAIVRKK